MSACSRGAIHTIQQEHGRAPVGFGDDPKRFFTEACARLGGINRMGRQIP
jgi:hypothetical protein